MAERITDKAWRQIVALGHTSRGTRGKVFRMSRETARQIMIERGGVQISETLYGVPVVLDRSIRDNVISLEER